TTLEAWVNINNSTSSRLALFASINGSNTSARALMLFNSAEQVQVGGRSTDAEVLQSETTSSAISTGTWHQVVGVIDYANDNVVIYIDGASVGTTGTPAFSSTSTPATDSTSVEMGSNNRGLSSPFLGSLDEVRISNNVRSATWIATEYNNQNSPSTFYSLASQEQQYASSGSLTSSIFDTEQASNWGTLTYTATTPSGTTLTVKARTSNSSSMSSASAFASCSGISSGADLSTNSCVTDTHRYVQYELTFATTDPTQTVNFQDITLAFSASDATAPTVTLTPIADPTNDTTPSLAGTATEATGTVSSVQFQIDSTSGTWNSCTADDGSFDEASEAFACAVTSSLTDSSHTMYVRATDSNSNTSSPVSDSFTVDTIGPTALSLQSPASSSYTNNTRQTFSWQAATDTLSGIANYSFSVDNPSLGSGQPSGDFSISGIPASQTTEYAQNTFLVSYAGFSDADTNNNYLSLSTKSSNNWNETQNDGKLREGKVTWNVNTTDNAGNTTSGSRILFVDQTAPNISIATINTTPFTSNTFVTTDQTPTFSGEIVDQLAGANDGQPQTTGGPNVASGPQQVEIAIQKKTLLGETLQSIYTLNIQKPLWQCDGTEIIDNTQQTCNKYSPFFYTPEQALGFGTYIITLIGTDNAGNETAIDEITLTISPFAQVTQIFTPGKQKPVPPKQQKQPEKQQEQEITEPLEPQKPSVPEEVGKDIEETLTQGKNVVQEFFATIGQGLSTSFQFVTDTRRMIVRSALDSGIDTMTYVSTGVGSGYHGLTEQTEGVVRNGMLSLESGVTGTGQSIDVAFNGVATITDYVSTQTDNAFSFVANKTNEVTEPVRVKLTAAYEVLFDTNPTRISDVKVAEVGKDYVIITWKTNHYTRNNKVNYGETLSYGKDAFGDDLKKEHLITLEKLKPGTKYVFEVMSQNKNYIYDAHHEVQTLPDKK
ncbi:MAG: LamG-like jellyroll fold domain-containing protein, partial [Patescibacteria group bacterium]